MRRILARAAMLAVVLLPCLALAQAAKPEPKPEPKAEAKPQAKPEAKPQAKPEAKPQAKPEAKPDAKAEAEKGQQLAQQVCAACHGPDGNSPLPANPKIAGQFADYVAKQLVNFKPQPNKKAERENPIMSGIVANLSEQDMRNVAAYYGAQKLRPEGATDKDLAARGQKLYRGGNAVTGVAACSGCHGPDGAGIPGLYPRISGQFASYLEAQLVAFKTGARANDPNGMMRAVASRLSEAEIKAVAEYASGLR